MKVKSYCANLCLNIRVPEPLFVRDDSGKVGSLHMTTAIFPTSRPRCWEYAPRCTGKVRKGSTAVETVCTIG